MIASVQYSAVSPSHKGPIQLVIKGPGEFTTCIIDVDSSKHWQALLIDNETV